MPLTNAQRRAALAETCTSLADLAEGFSPEQWALPTGCPGWTVFDQVAHVSSLESMLAGIEPIPYVPDEAPWIRNSIGRAMEGLVGARRGWSPAELLGELRSVVELRQRQLADVPDDGEVPGPTGRPTPLPAYLALRTFDCAAHEQDVRRAVGEPGGLDGLVGELLREHLPTLLPRVWDEPVALVLDGERVVVGDGEPRVTVVLSLPELVALMCGRADAAADGVETHGDQEAAGRLLASIAVTP